MTATTKIFLTVAALSVAVSAPAFAAQQRLTDSAYLQAVRCQALAESQGADVTAISAMLKAQKGGRDNFIRERAKSVARDAEREAGNAGDYRQSRIAGELSGVCAAYMNPTAEMASRR